MMINSSENDGKGDLSSERTTSPNFQKKNIPTDDCHVSLQMNNS
jgi:hypothetical protein